MYKFNGVGDYDINMDKEVVFICNALNSIPGIRTTESCYGHDVDGILIFFRSTDPMGLFFLLRSINNRYWRYGHKWKLEVDIGDHFEHEYPINYILSSIDKGIKAYTQSLELIQHMSNLLSNKSFMEYYNIDITKFKVVE